MKIARVLATGSVAAIITLLSAHSAQAVNPESFKIKTNGDLVSLCATPSDDPLYSSAIHFCHGYAVGFYQLSQAVAPKKKLFCLPESVSRTQAVEQYIDYSRQNAQYDGEAPVNVLTKFLVETFPCAAK